MINEKNYLIHFGNKNSGRYPRGSGENPHQHDGLGAYQRYKLDLKNKKQVYKEAKYRYKLNPSMENHANKKKARKEYINLDLTRMMKNDHKVAKEYYKSLKSKYYGHQMTNIQKLQLKVAKKEYKKTYSTGKSLAAYFFGGLVPGVLYINAKEQDTLNRHYGDHVPKIYSEK